VTLSTETKWRKAEEPPLAVPYSSRVLVAWRWSNGTDHGNIIVGLGWYLRGTGWMQDSVNRTFADDHFEVIGWMTLPEAPL
jgi:hypothetical protein